MIKKLTFQNGLLHRLKNRVLGILTISCFSVASTFGQTIRYVNSESAFNSAINAASTSVVDTIYVQNKIVLSAQLNTISKSVYIKGNGNIVTVSVPGLNEDGSVPTSTASSYRVFRVTGTSIRVTIDNLTIVGGDPNSGTESNWGGCIYNSAKNLVLKNCTISQGRNSAGGAGGIFNDGGYLWMYDCLLERNSAYYGGGFFNKNDGRMFAIRSTFKDNRTESTQGGGGAGENNGSSTYLVLNNSTFANNKSTERGGAINNCVDGIVYCVNSTFTGNYVYGDGNSGGSHMGGAIGTRGPLTIVNSLFAYNYRRNGGTITSPSSYTLDDYNEDVSGNDKVPADVYYSVEHSDNNYTNTTTGVIDYDGATNGSDDNIFAGGLNDLSTNGNGDVIGTGTLYQPHLYGSKKTARLINSTWISNSARLGVRTRIAITEDPSSGSNGSFGIAYEHPTNGWTTITGSTSSGDEVTEDQDGNTRSTSRPYCGAVEATQSALYMLKVRRNTDGSVNGGTLFGDAYTYNSSITLTATGVSGKALQKWVNDVSGSDYSTSNPLTLNLTSNLILDPAYVTSSSSFITYYGNGQDTGDAPAIQTVSNSNAVTISGPTMIKEGYYFDGWNTNNNGTGTNYSVGASYSNSSANLTLYAKWVAYNKYYIKSNATSSLNTASNWSNTPDGTGNAPSNFAGTGDLFILSNSAGSTSFSLSSNWQITGGLFIPTGATLTLGSSVTLQASKDLQNLGTISGTNATVKLAGSAMVTAGTWNINNLICDDGGVSLGVLEGSNMNIYGFINLLSGTTSIIGNGGVTLKSNSSGTAYIYLPGSGCSLTGIEVEQYVPARRAFRLVSPSVSSTGTIRENWQENGSSPTGYGTLISGSKTGANGFDVTGSGNASLFTFDNSTQSWSAIANTNVLKLIGGKPYRLFVRGDRNNPTFGNDQSANNTTLRATGDMTLTDVTVTDLGSTAGDDNFIGNPYHAPVNMTTIIGSNSVNIATGYYYVWDPKMSTRGAYVSVDLSTGSPSNQSSDADQYLQPQQACFVKTGSAGTTPSITFKTSAMSTAFSSTWRMTPPQAWINVSIHQRDSLEKEQPSLDGILIKFDESLSSDINDSDAPKLSNLDEEISTVNNGSRFSIEARNIPAINEIIPLDIRNYRDTHYSITIKFNGSLEEGIFLHDKFTDEYIALEEEKTTRYDFDLTSADASKNEDRFELIYQTKSGIEEIESNQLNFYPNPVSLSSGSVRVQVPALMQTNQEINLQIFDAIGRSVFRSNINGLKGSIDINLPAGLTPGIYGVQLSNGTYKVSNSMQVR